MAEQRIKKPGLWLPRPADKPIQVVLQDNKAEKAQTYVCYQPLRLGYGKECQLHMRGGAGPDVVFELNRVREPLRLSTPLAPEELSRSVELTVDGEPLGDSERELKPGSRVEILDKSTNDRYSLVVEPRRFWLFRPRVLAAIVLLLAVASGVSGIYVYRSLRGTQSELSRTEERLAQAESGVEKTEQRLQEAIDRIASAEQRLVESVENFRAGQDAAGVAIRKEFDQRLDTISKRARESLAKLSEQDTQARNRLEAATRADIAALRRELADEMVDSYQRFKGLEERLFTTLAEQIKPDQLASTRFKQILAASQQAIVFIRTAYQVKSMRTGEITPYSSAGTGFFVASHGLAITAQHVLFPWRYENEFIILEKLGLVGVVPESIRWSIWTTGETVAKQGSEPPVFMDDNAYQSGRQERALKLLFVPEIRVSDTTVASPLGLVTIQSPKAGPTDVAVLQVIDSARQFETLTLTQAPHTTEPLDDVLAIGYPYSRLQDGVAVPQAARGFVRRVSGDIMELDTPMHPGLSGGPILDSEGRVIGMAVGFVGSDVFGMAVRGDDLTAALEAADRSVRADQRRLTELGCYRGAISGRVDSDTWQAYLCEKQREEIRLQSMSKE